MSDSEEFHITIGYSPASDGWGFVGSVKIADHECYRTLRVFPTPTDARLATQVVMGDVLGALLAGQEWRSLSEEVGRTPTRADLRLGLTNAYDRQDSYERQDSYDRQDGDLRRR